MKTLVVFPAPVIFSQQAALAFVERNALAAYMTTFAYTENSQLARLVRLAPEPMRLKLELELSRRAANALPGRLVETRPFLEMVRVGAQMAGASAPIVDRIWDLMCHSLTRAAGQRLKALKGEAVYAYEYTALEAFEAAEACGAAKVLDFPSLNSRQFEELQRSEKANYPELAGPYETYFNARFESRQARRDCEMSRADVIITNSSVARRSHIQGGADPEKIFAVPYGAPPPIDTVLPRDSDGPLRVVWAGSFSIRKGAHLYIEAWRKFRGRDAITDVYGAVTLPRRLIVPQPPQLEFHGSIPRERLFAAFEQADVMIFPTLSDGFGMVVTEAFARGLPVITTTAAGASDLVRHGENGLIIPPGDVDAITGALDWCLNNREALASMRHAARDTAKNRQWVDYRRDLLKAVSEGLARAGYEPRFGDGD